MTIAARLHAHHVPKPNARDTRAQLRQLTEAIRDGRPITPHVAAELEREIGGEDEIDAELDAERRGPGEPR